MNAELSIAIEASLHTMAHTRIVMQRAYDEITALRLENSILETRIRMMELRHGLLLPQKQAG